ncbi:beta strand repeat-containing protein [Ureibacillus thermosphaericus]|uniref:beta strand repeat-containing protein n=1 Tax=Ureibacillus thermosphaericus TaxID=51173 RepID=UPI000BBBC010|nr:S-layer homology domain-containing protein [Ureibacillus thermosphaericus]
MAKIIATAFNLEPSSNVTTPFTDLNIKEYDGYIKALYELGITTGNTPTTFGGTTNVTRGQLATFVVRAENVQVETANEISIKISDISGNTITAGNEKYEISNALQGLFNTSNKAALKDAVVKAKVNNGQIVSVTSLELNAAGKEGALVTLDAKNASIAGDLKVNADFIAVKNLKVDGNITLTNKVSKEFSASGVTAKGELIIAAAKNEVASLTPVAAELTGPKVNLENVTITKVEVQRDGVAIASNSKLPEVVVTASVSTIQIDADVTKVIVDVDVKITVTGTGNIDEVAIQKAVELALQVAGEVAKLSVNNENAKVEVGTNVKIQTVVVPEGKTANSVITNYNSVRSNIDKVEDSKGNSVSTGSSGGGGGRGKSSSGSSGSGGSDSGTGGDKGDEDTGDDKGQEPGDKDPEPGDGDTDEGGSDEGGTNDGENIYGNLTLKSAILNASTDTLTIEFTLTSGDASKISTFDSITITTSGDSIEFTSGDIANIKTSGDSSIVVIIKTDSNDEKNLFRYIGEVITRIAYRLEGEEYVSQINGKVELTSINDDSDTNDGDTNDGGVNDGGTNEGDTNDGDTNDGDTNEGGVNDGDTNEGDTNEGDTNEGDTNEGDTNEGGTNDGDTNEGDTNEGGVNDGDTNEGGVNDGDTNEGDTNEGGVNDGDTNEGDTNEGGVNDGDTNEGDTNEGDTNDGDTNEGGVNDGDTNEGDTNEGDTNEGGVNEGDTNEGDTNEGDTNEGDTNEGGVNDGDTNEGGVNEGGVNDGDTNEGGVNDGDTNEGDTNEGDTNEGDTNEGDTNEGGTNEGGTNEGDTNEGGVNEGDTNEGDTNDGDTNEGGVNDGDTNEGDTNEGGSNDVNVPTAIEIIDSKVTITFTNPINAENLPDIIVGESLVKSDIVEVSENNKVIITFDETIVIEENTIIKIDGVRYKVIRSAGDDSYNLEKVDESQED